MNAALGRLLDTFAAMTPLSALCWMVAENFGLFFLALVGGQMLVRMFAKYRVTPAPPPVERLEITLAIAVVMTNSLVTLAGWALWHHGIIKIGSQIGLRALWDGFVLLILMDAVMYVLHRLAHHPLLYPFLHTLHHRYDHPRPLTLFVMNPLEALAFGTLWLAILCVYPASILGITLYISLNLAFGVIGHLGVEPVPKAWANHPILHYWGGSAFHAGHHVEAGGNFGFYTTVLDRMFGTYRTQISGDL